MVGAQQPAFEQAGDPVHSRHHDVRGIALGADDGPFVHAAVLGQIQVCLPTIGVDGRRGFDRATNPIKLFLETSGTDCIRTRPNPRGFRSPRRSRRSTSSASRARQRPPRPRQRTSHRPRHGRSGARDQGAPSPPASGAASPTRSELREPTRTPASAAGGCSLRPAATRLRSRIGSQRRHAAARRIQRNPDA